MNALVLSLTTGKRQRVRNFTLQAFAPVSSFLGCRSSQSFTDGNASSVYRFNVGRPRLHKGKSRQVSPSAKWVQQSATVVVETCCEDAYDAYANIQEMPNWSPWLREVCDFLIRAKMWVV